MTGYLHPGYAGSLAGFGVPHELPESKGWILERSIPASFYSDAMGCYPIFVCQHWERLDNDLEELGKDLISVSLVTDPFGDYDLPYLRKCFPDVTIPFKEHFVVELSRPLDTFIHPHHRRNARRARSEMEVERCGDPADFLDDWVRLYSTLIEKYDIKGIAAFSRESFARQLRVPGIVAFRALHNDSVVGMVLWYEQDKRAYYHLGAYSTAGYERGASFALFSHSIEYFAAHGTEWLNLGAGPGVVADAESGLSRFKHGWSTGTRTSYFCGRIFDKRKYDELTKARNVSSTNYFPAYRIGER
jgi:hypothetical protein